MRVGTGFQSAVGCRLSDCDFVFVEFECRMSNIVPICVTSPGKGVGQASMTLDIPKNDTC